MKKFVVCLLVLSLSFNVLAQEKAQTSEEPTLDLLWKDVKTTGSLLWTGFKYQFTQKENLYVLPVAIAANSYAFDNDDRIQNLYKTKDIPSIVDNIGDFGVFLNFPIAAIGTWYAGHRYGNRKLQNFAMEWAATTYIVLAESAVMSYIHIHERPNTDNLSKWETDFRGDSSWPSGHVAPWAALTATTFHYYGTAWALIPMGFTMASGYQRVQDQKHWFSDIVGTFFFSIFASYGVHAAMAEKQEEGVVGFLQRNNLHLGLTSHQGVLGPRVVFKF